MRKITFLFLVFIMLIENHRMSAEVMPVRAEGIVPGRVIILHAQNRDSNNNFFGGNQSCNTPYDSQVNDFVVVGAESEGWFYLQQLSTKQFLGKATAASVNFSMVENQSDAALFQAVSVATDTTFPYNITDVGDLVDDCQVDNLVRFITTVNNDGSVKTFLNCQNKTSVPKYHTGNGTLSVFYVYDAAAYITDGYETKEFGGEPLPEYVGVSYHCYSQENKDEIDSALRDYNSEYSADAYVKVSEAVNKENKRTVLDLSRYYLIENNENRNTFMRVTDEGKVGWDNGVTITASHIWNFKQAEDGKYYITSQSRCIDDPSSDGQAMTSQEPVTSFYLIDCNDGVYAFDCGMNSIASATENGHKGLQKQGSNIVAGWGTAAGTSKWRIKYVDDWELTMVTDWASLNLPFPVQLPKELKAYYAMGEESGAILLKELGSVVPAETPVVVSGSAGTYALSILGETAVVASENRFKGTLLPARPENVDRTYALGLVGKTAKFCLLNPNSVTIAANKTYYETTSVGENANFGFSFDDYTDIESVKASGVKAEEYYDLNGHRVYFPSKGIYVTSSGKKILFK